MKKLIEELQYNRRLYMRAKKANSNYVKEIGDRCSYLRRLLDIK